jgi:hypothetical protein
VFTRVRLRLASAFNAFRKINKICIYVWYAYISTFDVSPSYEAPKISLYLKKYKEKQALIISTTDQLCQ